MKCCGVERDSNFCPDCGEQLCNTVPLSKLLKHLEQSAAVMAAKAAKREEAVKRNPSSTKLPEYAKKMRRQEQKWAGWAEALRELMKGATDAT